MLSALAIVVVSLFSVDLPKYATAQTADTLFAWRSYAKEGHTAVHIFNNREDEVRPRTIVLQEVATNAGPSAVADLRHLVELIGRSFSIDPTAATWIVHWGSFSYEGATPSRREIFLRATFRRNKSGSLSAPSWRVLSREQVEDVTAHAYP